MASSGNTPFYRLLFIAIKREVLSIAAKSFTFLRRFRTSTGLVGSKLKYIVKEYLMF